MQPIDLFATKGVEYLFAGAFLLALVGMDDFAQKLLGKPGGFLFPAVGARVQQGAPAWQVQVDGHTIPMLSPVDGAVVAVNQDVVQSPALVNTEPYGGGWFYKVKLADAAAAEGLLGAEQYRQQIGG